MIEHSKQVIAGALVAMLVGIVSLIGWMVGHTTLEDALPGIANVTVNTALCLLLLSTATLLKGRFRPVSLGIAGFVTLFAMLVALQLVLGVNFGIDNLFYDQFTAYPDNLYPGRMSLITAIAFICSGIALLLIKHSGKRWWGYLAIGMLTGVIGVVGLYGLFSGLMVSEKPDFLSFLLSMSPFAAVAFLALTIALWGLYAKKYQFRTAYDIFYPATRLMFKLSFPKKFLLIAFVFLVPLAVSMQYTLSSLSSGIERAVKDHSDIIFLNMSSKLLMAVQRHRGILNAQLHGDHSFSKTSREKYSIEIRKALRFLQDQAHNMYGNESEQLQEIEKAWRTVEEKEPDGDAHVLWDIQTEAIRQTLQMIIQVGNHLSYDFDADFPVHDIMDAAVNHLPQIMRLVGEARGLGAGYLATGSIDEVGHYRLLSISNQVGIQMGKFKAHLAHNLDRKESVQSLINRQASEFNFALSAFGKLISKTFVVRKAFSIKSKDYFLKGSQVIDSAANLQSTMLNERLAFLTKDIKRKSINMYLIESIAFISILLSIFLFITFYRSIMHMIGTLAETAEQMKHGDIREMELMPEDELGSVVSSFNSIATELVHVSANMKAIVDYAVEGIITIDGGGFITSVNPSAERLFGYAREELVGNDVTMLMPEQYRARHRKGLAAHVSGGESNIIGQAVEVEALHKDGSIFPIDLSVNEMEIAGREPLFIGMVRDISDRKAKDLEIKQLATAVEQSVESIVITDSDGFIQYINPAFEALNGYTMDDVRGKTPRVLKSGMEKKQLYEDLWKTIKAGNTWKAQLTNKRKDGSYYDAEHTISPIFDASGEIINFVGFQHDRTSEIALQNKMEHAQRLESLGVLAGGIAHDFNNILTAIMGNVALAERRLEPDSSVSDFLVRIEDSAQSASSLCRQMLAYSGKGKFETKLINLSDLVEDITRLMEASIKKNVLLRCHLAPSLPAIEADESQLQQVILNLITNANEAIEDKSGVISLTTGLMHADLEYLSSTLTDTTLPEGRYVYLDVSDTGCGMDTKTVKKIFDPFFTTKFAGRGLGMSAVIGIVKGHHGALKIHSEVNRGTTFKILLPAAGSEAFLTPEKENVSTDSWRGHGTVLIVDDEDTIREVAAIMLEDMGFKTLSASDGQEAVVVYQQHLSEIVCVLMDMTMPRMDGAECFSQLKKINPDVKVILSSGYTDMDATPAFIGKGLAGFVQKPYVPETLQKQLQQIFEGRDISE